MCFRKTRDDWYYRTEAPCSRLIPRSPSEGSFIPPTACSCLFFRCYLISSYTVFISRFNLSIFTCSFSTIGVFSFITWARSFILIGTIVGVATELLPTFCHNFSYSSSNMVTGALSFVTFLGDLGLGEEVRLLRVGEDGDA